MSNPATTASAIPMRKLFITLAVIAVGIFLLFRLMQADASRMTAEAPATIVSEKPSDEGSGVDIEFSWVVNGTTHTSYDTDNQWIKNVPSTKVCYDPSSPGAGALEPGDKKCGE
jgi:hypothetical protein